MEATSIIPKNDVRYVHLLKLYLDDIGAMNSRIAISAVKTITENACIKNKHTHTHGEGDTHRHTV